MARAGPPAVVIDGAAAEQLEILRGAPVLRLRIVEGVDHAHAFHRHLVDAVDPLRLRQPGALQDRRDDVDEMMELPADAALVLDARRPGDHGGRAVAPARDHLLAVGERRGGGVGPGGRIAAVRLRAAEVVDVLRQVFERLRDAVVVAQLVHGAVQAALGRRAVVAGDVDDERVVELARLLDGLDDAADLVVGVLDRAAEDFHPAGADLLVGVAELVPRRQGRGPRRELGAGRDDPQLLLPRQDALAELVVAVVELAPVFARCTRSARRPAACARSGRSRRSTACRDGSTSAAGSRRRSCRPCRPRGDSPPPASSAPASAWCSPRAADTTGSRRRRRSRRSIRRPCRSATGRTAPRG